MILYDFQCGCGHIFEKMVKIDDRTCKCERCGLEARRLISAPTIKLEGWSGDFPSAKMKWVKQHEEAGRKTPPE